MLTGTSGLIAAATVFIVAWTISYKTTPRGSFEMEPRGPGSFEPHFSNYVSTTKLIISLAAGSIILMVSYLEVLAKQGADRVSFTRMAVASPLVLLACSIVFGVLFMGMLARSYEGFIHGQPYTRLSYSLNVALGFSTLISFSLGYLWLAFGLVQ